MALTVGIERWRLRQPFRIARGVKTEAVTVTARVSDGTRVGQGECTPYPRYGETPEDTAAEIATLRDALDPTAAPAALRARVAELLSAGAARNAVDCALWDLEAKQTGRRVADLAGLAPPAEVETAVTLSLDAPETMAAAAKAAPSGLIKAKLGNGEVEEEAARLRAIRAAAPTAKLIVDANEGWTPEHLAALDPVCAEIDALFIEQPLPSEMDDALDGLTLKTRLCADESCHGPDDLERLKGKFQVINIKLDKTGGLTEAIRLRERAMAQGFEVMIGCMVAGSLAMAPAYLLTQGALAVDLDGPLLLADDRDPPIQYQGAMMQAPPAALWG